MEVFALEAALAAKAGQEAPHKGGEGHAGTGFMIVVIYSVFQPTSRHNTRFCP